MKRRILIFNCFFIINCKLSFVEYLLQMIDILISPSDAGNTDALQFQNTSHFKHVRGLFRLKR